MPPPAALHPPDELGGLARLEHAADRRLGYQRRGGLVELVAFTECGRTLDDALDGRAHAGLNDIRGIEDDDAEQAPGGIAVGKPETRHASNSSNL
jgi:hypothetical protein